MNKKSKVILLPCNSYREELVYENLELGLELLGGIEGIIDKNESILLKPNLLKKAEVDKAVITHPTVVGMFARLMREKGYQDIVLADSCGNGTTSKVIHGTGMDTYLEKFDIPAIDYTKGIHVENPKGIQAKEFVLPKELLDRDCVISLCKMKTHALERITGAVKNSYGFVYGFHKAKGHTLYPSADSFARMLVDLNQYVKPRLYIMDGIVAMEGNGPGSGEPAPMNVMLMSQDPVALDSVFCHLIHLKPEDGADQTITEKKWDLEHGRKKRLRFSHRMVRSPWEMRLPSMAIHILMWTGEWHGPVCGSVSQRL